MHGMISYDGINITKKSIEFTYLINRNESRIVSLKKPTKKDVVTAIKH